jgi:hypothetical protein
MVILKGALTATVNQGHTPSVLPNSNLRQKFDDGSKYFNSHGCSNMSIMSIINFNQALPPEHHDLTHQRAIQMGPGDVVNLWTLSDQYSSYHTDLITLDDQYTLVYLLDSAPLLSAIHTSVDFMFLVAQDLSRLF